VVTWAQKDIRSVSIRPGEVTVEDAVLARAIRGAHRRGLQVLVFPILTVEETHPGQWRGTIAPASVAAWWLDYETFILHYARIAAAGDAEAFLVGSELASTEAWRGRWFHLISRVERGFHGALAYSANWDHYRGVSFWNRVDAIGISGYFELTDDRDAGVVPLTRAWIAARKRLVAFARARGKPLWLTEVGYTSRDGAATRPWDYTLDTPVDLEEQRRCYRALALSWGGVRELGGVFLWNWTGDGGPADRGYTARGKPAEQVLRRWFRAGATSRPSRSDPTRRRRPARPSTTTR
jgi:hypothetical protein